jgi:hypothetical protein
MPSSTGLGLCTITIGIVSVASFAARIAVAPSATRMSTGRRINSAAKSRSSSTWLPTLRHTKATVRPST